ncbi:hypothetical protein ACOTH8_23450 [Achromobacter xylosoxidans]
MGKSAWPEATAVMVTAACVALAIRGWPTVDDATMQQVWAAWAQAVGTVIAVVAAFLVGRQQSRSTLNAVERTHELGVLAKRNAIASVLDVAQMRVEEICAVLGPAIEDRAKLWLVYHPDIMESMATALKDAPVYELNSMESVEGLLKFREQLVFFNQALKKYYDGSHVDPHFMKLYEQYAGPSPDNHHTRTILVQNWHENSVRTILDQRDYLLGHYEKFKAAQILPSR